MKKNILFILSLAIMLSGGAIVALAEEDEATINTGVETDVRVDLRRTGVDTRTSVDSEVKMRKMEQTETVENKSTEETAGKFMNKVEIRVDGAMKKEEMRDGNTDTRKENAELRVENRAEKIDQRREGRADDRVNIEERDEENKEKRIGEAKNRISAYMERMFGRLTAAIERIEKLGLRVSSRISKLEERGIDVSSSKRLLAESKIEIQSAKDAVISARVAADISIASDNPKESFSEIRNIVKEIVSSIKKAHMAVVESIKALKASISINTNATTTVDTSLVD